MHRIKPQEGGNRSGVIWAKVTNANGAGIEISGPSELNIAPRRYTTEELAKAAHDHLLNARDESFVYIDHLTAGLGNNSCGPLTLPPYLIEAKPIDFTIRLKGI